MPAAAPAQRRKLIEVSLPLQKINVESAREKSIRHGHPSTLHLWWARRPLAAARSILFAQLVDDPSSRPDRFPTEEAQSAERERLFALIERLAVWENAGDTSLMRQAHAEIVEAFDGNVPTILDPFAGGGSIPLEAKRLGLHAVANDLNPLPVLLNTVMLEMVDRFPGLQPVSGGAVAAPAQALAADVRHYAGLLEERVQKRVGHLYPRARSGGDTLVYFWARAVTCPNPTCRRQVPLVGSWTASGRKGSEAFFRPVESVDGSFDVEIVHGTSPQPEGTMQRTGGHCPACGTAIPLGYVKAEGVAGRLTNRLLATQQRSGRARSFAPATEEDREVAQVDAPPCEWLDLPLSTHPQYMAPPRYGLTTFRHLFSSRQLTMLDAFVDELDGLRAQVLSDAQEANFSEDERRFANAGVGATAYADAVTVALALGIGRLVNRQSTLCIWDAPRGTVQQVFARQAYSMTWLFAEANPFAGASGSFSGQIDFLARAVASLPQGSGQALQGAAQAIKTAGPVVVSTDPPYYDSVPYADLSDFFHVWHRRMLGDVLPSVFSTVLSPKREELVADQVRLGGRQEAHEYFEVGMRDVFERLGSAHDPDVPMTVYYAFKQSGSDGGGASASTGWEAMLDALLSAGWSISGTWPVRTEQPGGLREVGRNALASSVVIVCRRRPDDAPVTTRRGLIQALQADLPDALKTLQQGSIAPVDLTQAAIGPGMAVFTGFSKVLEDDGSAMSVRAALAQINRALDEVLTEQENDFDSNTRFALQWFRQNGFDAGAYGDAHTLANARGANIDALARSGILTSRAGAVRLLAPSVLPVGYDPATDTHITVWEVVMHLARTMATDGMPGAAALMARLPGGVDLGVAKELVYLLFDVAEGRKQTADALMFNGLAAGWNEIVSTARSTVPPPSQGTLDFASTDTST